MELELLKRFEAVQMEIDLHICSFQNPLSLLFSFLTECLRIPFLFTLTASFIREKPVDEASFPNRIHLTLTRQVGWGLVQ